MLWYYARNGQRFGPVEEAELQRLAGAGQLSGTDLVWKPGLPEWQPAGQMPELASFYRPAAPPPPPPPPSAPVEYSPYAPPSAPLTSAPAYLAPVMGATPGVEYASFGSRFAALLIDQIILGAVGFALGVGFTLMTRNEGGQLILNAISLLVSWFYFAGLESSAQMATLGKRALGLRVTDLQGQRIDFGRASGRYFGKILSTLAIFIGFLTMISDEKKQTWHDKMAGCLVLRQR